MVSWELQWCGEGCSKWCHGNCSEVVKDAASGVMGIVMVCGGCN